MISSFVRLSLLALGVSCLFGQVVLAKSHQEIEKLSVEKGNSHRLNKLLYVKDASYENNTVAAYVVGSAAVVFTDKVSAEHKQDVTDSVLMAMLNSDIVVQDRYNHVDDWNNNYANVLLKAAWIFNPFQWYHDKHTGDPFEVAQALQILLEPRLSGDQYALLKALLLALQDQNSEQYKVFSQSAAAPSGYGPDAIFQVVIVDEDKDGYTSMTVMPLAYHTNTNVPQILWYNFFDKGIDFTHGVQVLTQNKGLWDNGLRKQIREKLAPKEPTYIFNLPLQN